MARLRQGYGAAGTNASTATKDQYGKTKCTWAFSEPQSASCLAREIKPKTEAAAAPADQEKFLQRASADRPVD
ncbi:MAG: hypothetical protein DME54_09720 [Verrucomicrobia bacterium]|nr:MAG: hypothetical protein DMF09_12955 [Verrucomicrobiota bacterium]PYJ93572.1 MAG: hypothetical protein DME62_08240 [Verrucomicrobiota bacterium]PYK34065.1 MAG: hypothetical protein DME54_09720 [Verrucomicrobiota bacterium]PYL80590.1 MAG: hypothetical protein DMF21_08160 [Verrucomicrobiota bacterium]